MRTFGKLGDDAKLHQAVAAYCSDHRLLSTPLLGHKLSTYTNGIQIMASLDHSMWFHAPFRYGVRARPALRVRLTARPPQRG